MAKVLRLRSSRSHRKFPSPPPMDIRPNLADVQLVAATSGPTVSTIPNIPKAPTTYDLADAINKAIIAIHQVGTHVQQVDAHIQQLSQNQQALDAKLNYIINRISAVNHNVIAATKYAHDDLWSNVSFILYETFQFGFDIDQSGGWDPEPNYPNWQY